MVKKISPHYTNNVAKYAHLTAKLGALDKQTRRFQALGRVTTIIADAYRKGDIQTLSELRMAAQAAALDRQKIHFEDMIQQNKMREAYEINQFKLETDPPLFDSSDITRIFAHAHKYIKPLRFVRKAATQTPVTQISSSLLPSVPSSATPTVNPVLPAQQTSTKQGHTLDATLNNPFSDASVRAKTYERLETAEVLEAQKTEETEQLTQIETDIARKTSIREAQKQVVPNALAEIKSSVETQGTRANTTLDKLESSTNLQLTRLKNIADNTGTPINKDSNGNRARNNKPPLFTPISTKDEVSDTK